jgi:cytochrome c peroxidase
MAFMRAVVTSECLRRSVIAIGGWIGLAGIVAGAAPAPDTDSTAYKPDTESTAYKMARHDPLSAAAQVGQRMFFDKTLSASGKLSCATCHDPGHAYAPPNGLSVQPGGKTLSQSGTRAVPSLRYKQAIPPYADLLDNPDGVSTPGPGGGFTQDGRAPTLAEQAKIPLLAANEMANADGAEVVAKIRRAPYARLFTQAFGDDVFASPATAFQRATEALQAFELEDYSFHPFSSKYDLFSGNKVGGSLTEAELRGLRVFVDPNKGNCAACHYAGPGLQGTTAMFTDYSYSAIGAPRNPSIPANRDPRHYDLGICSRPDHPLPANRAYCGMFKTPTLRNVATRAVFFHNGQIKSLKEAIRFYNTRDTEPERWYPTVRGVAQKFDDLPPQFRGNVDKQAPLDGRARGSAPPMSPQDMDDLEAFLNTLTDDYRH